MKAIIVIQARMGSNRLPGKVLMPLGKSIVLDYVVSRCQQVKQVTDVIVATSFLAQDEAIVQWCNENDVTCFRGSEDDVLSRYYECAKREQADYVIRVTADCPFVDYELMDNLIEAIQVEPADVAVIKGNLPRGLVAELVSFPTLEYIFQHGQEPRHREHVTYYAYEYAHLFNIQKVKAPDYLEQPQLRITLDTEEDYQLCKAIANYFAGTKLISTAEVIQFLLDHPEIAAINAHIQQKPVI